MYSLSRTFTKRTSVMRVEGVASAHPDVDGVHPNVGAASRRLGEHRCAHGVATTSQFMERTSSSVSELMYEMMMATALGRPPSSKNKATHRCFTRISIETHGSQRDEYGNPPPSTGGNSTHAPAAMGPSVLGTKHLIAHWT